MRNLTVEEVLEVNTEVMGRRHALRDHGLLESAAARPRATAFGADAYHDLVSKTAALLHSLVLNHAFVDGSKRTAVLATLVLLDLNGTCFDGVSARRLTSCFAWLVMGSSWMR
jgi:death-on-curing protein